MLSHAIVQDFQEISKLLVSKYRGCWLEGPTGHWYQISEESFRNCLPCYLQSYEFGLLAGATLAVMRRYPAVEVVGHYHDGDV